MKELGKLHKSEPVKKIEAKTRRVVETLNMLSRGAIDIAAVKFNEWKQALGNRNISIVEARPLQKETSTKQKQTEEQDNLLQVPVSEAIGLAKKMHNEGRPYEFWHLLNDSAASQIPVKPIDAIKEVGGYNSSVQNAWHTTSEGREQARQDAYNLLALGKIVVACDFLGITPDHKANPAIKPEQFIYFPEEVDKEAVRRVLSRVSGLRSSSISSSIMAIEQTEKTLQTIDDKLPKINSQSSASLKKHKLIKMTTDGILGIVENKPDVERLMPVQPTPINTSPLRRLSRVNLQPVA